ncbi:hypothetical protein BsWGS_01045 [Bradybaena similaris]
MFGFRSDNTIRLRQFQRTQSRNESTQLHKTGINQTSSEEIHSLKLHNESRIPVFKFLARINVRNSTHPGVKVTHSDSISETGNPSSPQPLRRLYKRTPAIDNFRTAYTSFYQRLQSFLKQLSQRFKEGTSEILQNIHVIAEVMPLDDPDIIQGNRNKIIQKFFIVEEATSALLDNIRPFVMATHLQWLRSQSLILQWRMNIVGLEALSLGLQEDGADVLSK